MTIAEEIGYRRPTWLDYFRKVRAANDNGGIPPSMGGNSGDGGDEPPRIGSVRTAPDRDLPLTYTGGVSARAPLRELGPVDLSDLVQMNDAGRLIGVSRDQIGRLASANLRGERRLAEIEFASNVAGQHRTADVRARILEEARQRAGRAAVTVDTAQLVEQFVRGMTWELHIPGTHYSGLTNDELMDIFMQNDRPFAEDTPELRTHVRDRLSGTFSRGAWDVAQAVRVTMRAIRDWIVARFLEQGKDIELRPLSAKYRHWKEESGYDRRIGIKTGAWLGSIKHAEIRVTAPSMRGAA